MGERAEPLRRAPTGRRPSPADIKSAEYSPGARHSGGNALATVAANRFTAEALAEHGYATASGAALFYGAILSGADQSHTAYARLWLLQDGKDRDRARVAAPLALRPGPPPRSTCSCWAAASYC